MSANTIITSIVTGGSNNHTTIAEEANAIPTDFVTQGVVGAITLNTGSGGTGSFCVNADASPDMGVTVKAGQAYISATPSSQDAQVLRVRAASDYTAYTINANASGSTKYDWIYLNVDATKSNNPASDASDVTSVYTSRSSSNSTDNGTPPTYGLLLAIITVANGASSITNSNITDKRFNTSIGAQNGSLIVTQQSTGLDAIIQAAGIDANVNINIVPKGTGTVKFNGLGAMTAFTPTYTNLTVGAGVHQSYYTRIGNIVICRIGFAMGSGSSMGTNPSFTLPVASKSTYTLGTYLGSMRYVANSAGYMGYVQWKSTTDAYLLSLGTNSTDVTITSTAPNTWGTTGSLYGIIIYEAA